VIAVQFAPHLVVIRLDRRLIILNGVDQNAEPPQRTTARALEATGAVVVTLRADGPLMDRPRLRVPSRSQQVVNQAASDALKIKFEDSGEDALGVDAISEHRRRLYDS
jgi:hypothetical protein